MGARRCQASSPTFDPGGRSRVACDTCCSPPSRHVNGGSPDCPLLSYFWDRPHPQTMEMAQPAFLGGRGHGGHPLVGCLAARRCAQRPPSSAASRSTRQLDAACAAPSPQHAAQMRSLLAALWLGWDVQRCHPGREGTATVALMRLRWRPALPPPRTCPTRFGEFRPSVEECS